MSPDQHGNVRAREGVTRCPCGAKYWEQDRCVSCGEAYRPPTVGDEVQARQVWGGGHYGDLVVGRIEEIDHVGAVLLDDDGLRWAVDPATIEEVQ